MAEDPPVLQEAQISSTQPLLLVHTAPQPLASTLLEVVEKICKSHLSLRFRSCLVLIAVVRGFRTHSHTLFIPKS